MLLCFNAWFCFLLLFFSFFALLVCHGCSVRIKPMSWCICFIIDRKIQCTFICIIEMVTRLFLFCFFGKTFNRQSFSFWNVFLFFSVVYCILHHLHFRLTLYFLFHYYIVFDMLYFPTLCWSKAFCCFKCCCCCCFFFAPRLLNKPDT